MNAFEIEVEKYVNKATEHLKRLGAGTIHIEGLRLSLEKLGELAGHNGDDVIERFKGLIASIRTDPENQSFVLQALLDYYERFEAETQGVQDHILQALFGSALGGVVVPEWFWSSEVGKAILHLRQGAPIVLLSVEDASRLLGVTRQYLHEEIGKKKIPYQQVGKYNVLMLTDVLSYHKKRRNQVRKV